MSSSGTYKQLFLKRKAFPSAGGKKLWGLPAADCRLGSAGRENAELSVLLTAPESQE